MAIIFFNQAKNMYIYGENANVNEPLDENLPNTKTLLKKWAKNLFKFCQIWSHWLLKTLTPTHEKNCT